MKVFRSKDDLGKVGGKIMCMCIFRIVLVLDVLCCFFVMIVFCF